MNLGLDNKVALVTAASKGLGRAMATALAAEGATVVLSSRNEASLAATAAEIRRETGREVFWQVADLANAAQIEALVTGVAERHGSLHVLVNNTGGPPAGNFASTADAAWQGAFESVLMSAVRCIRAALPHMRQAGFGRILNVASSSFKQPLDNLILSNTFRTALIGLAKSLATELAPDGILINTLGPGRIATDRVASLDQMRAERTGLTPAEVRRQAEGQIPLGRYGEPAEFARMAAFLVSAANSYVTGQAFLVDGGLVKAI